MNRWLASFVLAAVAAAPACAANFTFSTGLVDGRMGMLSRPGSTTLAETEAADDFLTASTVRITGGTFTGLLVPGASGTPSVLSVGIEIYRVFPLDSTVPPSGNVPTRTNSPSDVAFATRGTTTADLTVITSTLNPNFTVANTVVNGIHKVPNQTTGGEGSATGVEMEFDFGLPTGLLLPANHYFFVPQVATSSGEFLWLSAPKPIVSPGTPFTPDLQTWIRNDGIAPDWLRVGTDIVGGAPAPTFNAAFSLNGDFVTTALPTPSPLALLLLAMPLGWFVRRRR